MNNNCIRLKYYYRNSLSYLYVFTCIVCLFWLEHSLYLYLEGPFQYTSSPLLPITLAVILFLIYKYPKYINKVDNYTYLEITPDIFTFRTYLRKITIKTCDITYIYFHKPNTMEIIYRKQKNNKGNIQIKKIKIPLPNIIDYKIINDKLEKVQNADNYRTTDKYQDICDIINYFSNKSISFSLISSDLRHINAKVYLTLFIGLYYILFSRGMYSIWSAEPPFNEDNEDIVQLENGRGYINGYEYIDLGLSVAWATMNLGAEEPSDSGKYYIWGNIHDITHPEGAKESKQIKRKKKWGGEIRLLADEKYDAARAKMGGRWRMPMVTEIEELQRKCIFEVISINNNYCLKATGPNGNHIILPLCGFYLSEEGSDCPNRKIRTNLYGRYLTEEKGSSRHTYSGVNFMSIINKDYYGTELPSWGRPMFGQDHSYAFKDDSWHSEDFAASIRPVANLEPASYYGTIFRGIFGFIWSFVTAVANELS